PQPPRVIHGGLHKLPRRRRRRLHLLELRADLRQVLVVTRSSFDVNQGVFHTQAVTIDEEHCERDGAARKLPAQRDIAHPLRPQILADPTIEHRRRGRRRQPLLDARALRLDQLALLALPLRRLPRVLLLPLPWIDGHKALLSSMMPMGYPRRIS